MTIYGLLGFTHGWARVLTVMSPEGSARLLAALGTPADVSILAGDGALPRLLEKRGGALQRIVEAHGIEVVERPQWEALKRQIGEAALR